jgi:hypothetical protein
MKRKIAVLIGAMLLIMTAVFYMLYNKPHRSVKGAEPAFELSVSQLIEAFSNDETRADSMYTGKIIQVTGSLRKMIRNDSTLILVLGGDEELMGVSCYMEKSQIPGSEQLTRGESITVKGFCNGMLMDVVLDNGILVKDDD